MFIYSKKIFLFIQEIKSTIKEILKKEVNLKVHNDRFYNWSQSYSYPIKIVIYNNKPILGYFNADFFELGFHERLMIAPKSQLHSIIRHELAHYLVFIKHGANIQSHGQEFKTFCKDMGWGEEISNATFTIDEEHFQGDNERSAILRKIEKLMALASSSNENEAEQALIKSRELLQKHQIEEKYLNGDDELYIRKRILEQRRETAKMRAIGQILETFFVNIVYSRGGPFIYLEVLGKKENVEIAEYVSDVLDHEFERMWDHAKKNIYFKGAVAKNSFFLGIAKGYCSKVQALMRRTHQHLSHSLMVIEKQLIEIQNQVYSNLSTKRSKGTYCPRSASYGEMMGNQLNLKAAIKRPNQQGLLI